jgi:hypothetical protein
MLCPMPLKIDLTGKVFGRLTVVGDSGKRTNNRQILWECICVCEERTLVCTYNLRSGRVFGCGCQRNAVRHGHARAGEVSKTHHSWTAMKQRCLNSKCPGYADYGGRGITICDRWIESFESFLSDMGEKPEGKSLDRIDNDGNYNPSNCKWSTPVEQASNRRPMRARKQKSQ